MGAEPSDALAIHRSLTHPASFEIIFDRHYTSVYAYITRSVGADAAPDLTQEAFLTAYAQRQRFRTDHESARPWLFGIAANLVRRWFRSESRRRRMLRRWTRRGETMDFTPEAVDRLSAQEVRRRLRDALGTLPEHERDVLVLFALGDLSYDEIAAAVSSPVGTVKSRLHRGRRRLRWLLREDAEAILGPQVPDDENA